jgi:hypothetical protein
MFSIAALKLRTRAPMAVRRLYRLARSFERPLVGAALPAALVQECRFVASRSDLLDILPRSGRVAELGTYKGDFAKEILARNAPRELHLVDVDVSRIDSRVLDNPRVRVHHGLTRDVIASFPNNYFDWIYVDADHSYDAVSLDARLSSEKIRPGGFLVFNDFTHIDQMLGRYGVHRAVVDFANENRWPLAFFAFEPSALYDVALRKPDAPD